MRRALALLLALWPLADAAAQGYGPCQDRARDRLTRDQQNRAIGPDRALNGYLADIQECQRQDVRDRARDRTDDLQRAEQQRLDRQRDDQQRLDQLRARQRDDMLRNRQ